MEKFPELKNYNEDHYFEYVCGSEEPNTWCSDYAITFSVDNDNYECVITAWSQDEALGIFFRLHPNITYNMVIAIEG